MVSSTRSPKWAGKPGPPSSVLHHTGKDLDKGPRGNVALPAACDTMIATAGSTKTHITVSCKKQKDCEQFAPYSLDAKKIIGSDDPDGSLVLVPLNRTKAALADLGSPERATLEDLNQSFEQRVWSFTDGQGAVSRPRQPTIATCKPWSTSAWCRGLAVGRIRLILRRQGFCSSVNNRQFHVAITLVSRGITGHDTNLGHWYHEVSFGRDTSQCTFLREIMGIFELVSRGIMGHDTTWVGWYHKLCVSLDTQSDTKPILYNYSDQQQQPALGRLLTIVLVTRPPPTPPSPTRPGSDRCNGGFPALIGNARRKP